MKFKRIVLLILIFLLFGCTTNKENDAIKFKKEYENYNKSKIKLEISKNNIIEYKTTEEINNILKNKTGVIFIGNPKDNLSRASIKILLDASESTDLQTIYYIDSMENINLDLNDTKIPLVLNVLDVKILSYHIGTINDKEKLSEEEELELYNIYTNGIHEVLQDTCNEEC